jgi:hypothetical protein
MSKVLVVCAGAMFPSALLREYLNSSNRCARKKSFDWVRPWLLRRDTGSSGSSARLAKKLADEDSLSYKKHLRLTANRSEKLLIMVEGFNKQIRYYNDDDDFTEDRVGNNIKLATDLAGE